MLSVTNNTILGRRSSRPRTYTEKGQELYGVDFYRSLRSSSRASSRATSKSRSGSRLGTASIIQVSKGHRQRHSDSNIDSKAIDAYDVRQPLIVKEFSRTSKQASLGDGTFRPTQIAQNSRVVLITTYNSPLLLPFYLLHPLESSAFNIF